MTDLISRILVSLSFTESPDNFWPLVEAMSPSHDYQDQITQHNIFLFSVKIKLDAKEVIVLSKSQSSWWFHQNFHLQDWYKMSVVSPDRVAIFHLYCIRHWCNILCDESQGFLVDNPCTIIGLSSPNLTKEHFCMAVAIFQWCSSVRHQGFLIFLQDILYSMDGTFGLTIQLQ